MTTIIAGSRTLGIKEVRAAMSECPWEVTEVVSGRARGVDEAGEVWAAEQGIPVRMFPADWARDGRAAGMIRNVRMGLYAKGSLGGGGLVAVWDGVSTGTGHMIRVARKQGLRVMVWDDARRLGK